jgi:hypothetical protein
MEDDEQLSDAEVVQGLRDYFDRLCETLDDEGRGVLLRFLERMQALKVPSIEVLEMMAGERPIPKSPVDLAGATERQRG